MIKCDMAIYSTVVRILHKIYICHKKGFPLRLLIASDVNPLTVPNSTRFPHPVGIVISECAKIGHGCEITQNVTIGARYLDTLVRGYPNVESNVVFGAGSIILGDITIGDNATIGAGAIVLKDVPAGATITGVWS